MSLVCKKCGKVNKREDSKFCNGCGNPFPRPPLEIKPIQSPIDKLREEERQFFHSRMVLIEGGSFKMGSTDGYDDEKPIRKIDVSSFYMASYLVTNRDYCIYDFRRNNPGDNLPVSDISWYDAISYCNWLSREHGLTPCYSGINVDVTCNGYRLPSEVEWEYACRGGSISEYYWGEKIDSDYFWYFENSEGLLQEVGGKEPNPLGLYDMIGNIWEWCNDIYSNYASEKDKFPMAPCRVLRGGSWYSDPYDCRSAVRNCYYPQDKYFLHGFRLVKNV